MILNSRFPKFRPGLALFAVLVLVVTALPAGAQGADDTDPCAELPERVLERRAAFRETVEESLDRLLAAVNSAVIPSDSSPEICTEELVHAVAAAMYAADREIERYPVRMRGNWFRHPCILNDVRNYERVVGELMQVVYRECEDELDVAEIICPSQRVILENLSEAVIERLRQSGTGPLAPACPGAR